MADLVIGVVAAGRLAAGLVAERKLAGSLHVWPEPDADSAHASALQAMPMEAIVETIVHLALSAIEGQPERPVAVGVGFPGIVRNGIVEDSPNLRQSKGARLGDLLEAALRNQGLDLPVFLQNDADAMAAGIAAGQRRAMNDTWGTERIPLLRTWTLGNGVGFGRYPFTDGVWEGGHTVVTLDPKEGYCGCGGKGHLEGIVGARAMRLRFLDLEPEEVFARATEGEARCADFVKLWHRALAAATASSIHMDGPGRFYITGRDAKYVQVGLLSRYLSEMVTMSPLQGSVFEVIETNEDVAVIGAGVNALASLRSASAG